MLSFPIYIFSLLTAFPQHVARVNVTLIPCQMQCFYI